MLADKLGSDHDLNEFMLYLNRANGFTDITIPLHLIAYVNLKHMHLQRGIMPMALRIFSEKPGSFAGRLTSCYRIYRGEDIRK
jgi:hypothetical protein